MVTHFRDRSSKDDNFVELAYPLHELVDPRSLDNVNIMILPFYLHWNSEVRLMQNLHLILAVKLAS